MNNSNRCWQRPASHGLPAALCVVILAGCGGNPADYPDTAPVTGTVTLDGQPLEGARVSFTPQEGRSSSGTTDAQGKYELNYTGDIKGSMLGTARVSISKEIPDPDFVAPPAPKLEEGELDPGPPEPDMINSLPDRYRGRDSELSAEVKDGVNVIDFDLSS